MSRESKRLFSEKPTKQVALGEHPCREDAEQTPEWGLRLLRKVERSERRLTARPELPPQANSPWRSSSKVPRATPPSSGCCSATPAARVSSEGPDVWMATEKHRLVPPLKLCLQKWMPPQPFLLSPAGQVTPRHLPGPAAAPPSAPASQPPTPSLQGDSQGRVPAGLSVRACRAPPRLQGALRVPRGHWWDFPGWHQGQLIYFVTAGASVGEVRTGAEGEETAGPAPSPCMAPPSSSVSSDQSHRTSVYCGLPPLNT